MLLNPFLKKLPYIKPIEKQYKTIERILFHVLNIIVTKKTQVISSNFFVLAQEISDLVPRISSTLRSFLKFFLRNLPYSRISTAVRCPRKDVEISYQSTKRFNKTPKWAVRFTLLLGYHHIYFSFH